MSTRETSLWRWLSRARKQERSGGLHIQRVENSVASGTPDVEGCLRGHGQFWIELKSVDRPKRTGGRLAVKIRDAQVEWMRRRYMAGGNVWMLIQVGRGNDAERYLVHGCKAKHVQDGVTEDWLRNHCRIHDFSDWMKTSPLDIVELACGLS
jgi:hypothetical protein